MDPLVAFPEHAAAMGANVPRGDERGFGGTAALPLATCGEGDLRRLYFVSFFVFKLFTALGGGVYTSRLIYICVLFPTPAPLRRERFGAAVGRLLGGGTPYI